MTQFATSISDSKHWSYGANGVIEQSIRFQRKALMRSPIVRPTHQLGDTN